MLIQELDVAADLEEQVLGSRRDTVVGMNVVVRSRRRTRARADQADGQSGVVGADDDVVLVAAHLGDVGLASLQVPTIRRNRAAAEGVDLEDVIDLSVLVEDDLSRELKEKGLARAKAFSWQRTAEETAAIYENAVSERL